MKSMDVRQRAGYPPLPSLADEAQTKRVPAEISLDLAVHGLAIAAALIGTVVLLTSAGRGPARWVDIALFVCGIFAMLISSALYNAATAWPRRRLLRRFDHAAIFLMIAGTYAPVLGSVPDDRSVNTAYFCVWIFAAAGIALKLLSSNKFERGFILLYLALGWSGLSVLGTLSQRLPESALALIGVGAALYTIGVGFHLWERLPYQAAIWHGFVACAAAAHFGAVIVLAG
jgi:hemolysin III